jgi:hypothetical protein
MNRERLKVLAAEIIAFVIFALEVYGCLSGAFDRFM